MTKCQRRPGDIEPGSVDTAEGLGEPEPVPAKIRRLPGLERAQDLRGKRLVDLEEIEVGETQACIGEHPGYCESRCHQQAVAIDEIHCRGLAVAQVRQHRQIAAAGPCLRRQKHRGRAVGHCGRVAGCQRAVLTVERRAKARELFETGIAAQRVVGLQSAKLDQQVVEKAGVVGLRRLLMALERQLVLIRARDRKAAGHQFRALAHGQARARFDDARRHGLEKARSELQPRRESCAERLGPEARQQHLLIGTRIDNGCITGRVDSSGNARLDLPERNLVADGNRRFQARATGTLQVVCGCRRRQARRQHAFPGQVPLAGVLEYCAGSHLTQLHALQRESFHERGQRSGQHFLVARRRVGALRTRERYAHAADDRDPPGL